MWRVVQYKEYAFKTSVHTDIYYLTTCVSTIQVLFGFMFLPMLALPMFGGVPFNDIPSQLTRGWSCFLNRNSLPGDDCRHGFVTMLRSVSQSVTSSLEVYPDGYLAYSRWWRAFVCLSVISYVAVNFGYNVFQLLITKHGGATVLVISAALALPVTNMAFSWTLVMGE